MQRSGPLRKHLQPHGHHANDTRGEEAAPRAPASGLGERPCMETAYGIEEKSPSLHLMQAQTLQASEWQINHLLLSSRVVSNHIAKAPSTSSPTPFFDSTKKGRYNLSIFSAQEHVGAENPSNMLTASHNREKLSANTVPQAVPPSISLIAVTFSHSTSTFNCPRTRYNGHPTCWFLVNKVSIRFQR